MKLNLIFIAMDLLTLMAYPIVFIHGKLRWFLKTKGSVALAQSWQKNDQIEIFL